MPPDPDLVDLLLVRSRLRVQVLLALLVLGHATARRVARHIEARPDRVRAALEGARDEYARERSLVASGLADTDASSGSLYRLTPDGLRIASGLALSWTDHAADAVEHRLFAYVRKGRALAPAEDESAT